MSEEIKEWQHGYDLEFLKSAASRWDKHNGYSDSPFSAMKKNNVAELLHNGELYLDPDGKTGYVEQITKVRTPINCYNGVTLAHKEPGDHTFSYITGDPVRLRDLLREYNRHNQWAFVFADDDATNDELLCSGFRRIGSKVTTFGEIYFVWFRDSEAEKRGFFQSDRRTFTALSPAEHVSIKRLTVVPSALIQQIADKLEGMSDLRYENHYSNYNKGKSWSALSLKGYSDDPNFIAKPLEMSKKWKLANPEWEKLTLRDTPLRKEFPQVEDLIAFFADEEENVERIRFMQLKPGGGELERHTDQVDSQTGITEGKNARVHFPIKTNPGVIFNSWDFGNRMHTVNMVVGEGWYLDTRKPHRAVNGGASERIHLVIDFIVTPKFLSYFRNL
jgi:hypothetical protein